MPRKIGSKGGIRPSTLKKMSGDQLKKAGYVRIPGFTRKDGTKVKSHIRMLKPATGGKEVTKQFAELAIDFTPIIGDIKAAGEAAKAFSDKDYLTGALLSVAAVVGVVPLIGDAARIPIKVFANTLKASSKVVKAATKAAPSTADLAVKLVAKSKVVKFSDEGVDLLKQVKAAKKSKIATNAERKARLLKESKAAKARLADAKKVTKPTRAEKAIAKQKAFKEQIKKEVADNVAVQASKTVAKVKVAGKDYAVKKVRKNWLRIEAHGMHFEGNSIAAVKESLAFHVKHIL